ncbi:MAG: PilN domain-containing protein [Pseudomonadota bacterium]
MSHRFDLDFIQHSPFSLSSWTWLGISVLLTSFVISIFTWQLYQTKQVTQAEVSSKLLEIEQQLDRKETPVNHISIEIAPDERLQIQATVAALMVPWASLLLGIEASDVQDVALLSFEPNRKKNQVTLTGEAKNLETIFAYIQKLEAQPMLEKVYLLKHHIDEANPSKPVSFTVLLQWKNIEQSVNTLQSQSNEKINTNEQD